MNNKTYLKHVTREMLDGKKILIEIELHSLGIQKPYFSITAEHDGCFGCIHDRILQARPDFKLFTELHLSDISGAPMHALANGLYYAEQSDAETLAKHFRIPLDEANEICWTVNNYDFASAGTTKKRYFQALVDTYATRWSMEAGEAIQHLHNLILKER